MSVAQQITAGEVQTYLRTMFPDWNLRRRQLHVPCPIHQGVRDSFSMNTETGQWKCHSECDRGGDLVDLEMELGFASDEKEAIKRIEEIVGTTFVQQQRMFTPRVQTTGMNIVKEYDYRDEEGRKLFQVVRMDPKGFRQRHWDAVAGKWVWNLDGVRRVPYNLPQVRQATGPIFFVEGEKDANRMMSLGLTATTTPGGAGSWRDEYAQYFENKVVYVIPDNDEPKEKGVRYPGQAHGAAIMRGLLAVAKRVMLIELIDVKDVSDWLDVYGEQATSSLLNQAQEATPNLLAAYELRYTGTAKTATPTAAPAAKAKTTSEGRHVNAIAEEILSQHKLISWGENSAWEYNGTIWEQVTPKTVQQWALKAESAYSTKSKRRREIADYVLLTTRLERIDWRNGLGDDEVPVENGVINLRTGAMRPHRPEDFLESVMPVQYTPGATCESLIKALAVAWRGDSDFDHKVLALQEFFGYVLMPHAKFKKALLLYGAPDSGKSQILALLQGMVGRGNYCSISVKDMDDPRKLAPIRGKMLNALSELSQSAMIADGGFKTLVSTGDAIQIDAKYEQPEEYRPFAKHVIVTNALPRVNDMTDATFNRMLLLKFNRSLPVAEQDKNLLDKLLAEAPGVLNWALVGAKRLLAQKGEFTAIPESTEVLADYKSQSNGIDDFVHIYCRKSEGNDIPIEEFRDRFNQHRGDKRITLPTLRKMLLAAMGAEGSDKWFVKDLAWKNR